MWSNSVRCLGLFQFLPLKHISCRHMRRAVRGGRVVPPEYLGRYVPQISADELEEFRSKAFTQYPNPDIPSPDKFSTKITEGFPVKRFCPEFMPYREGEMCDKLAENLERREMSRRRRYIDIPEFHVGSIVAVTLADPHAPNKINRFVGICILRHNAGLFSSFMLRNVIDKVAIEVEYHLYSLKMQKMELLKLQRSVDHNMLYLRDAPYEYSTVPFDMTPVPYSATDPVPVITEKVRLFPPPWHTRWYLHGYKGIDEEDMLSHLTAEDLMKMQKYVNYVDRYDLMKIYRQESSRAETEAISVYVASQFEAIQEFKAKKKQEEIARYKTQRQAVGGQ